MEGQGYVIDSRELAGYLMRILRIDWSAVLSRC